MLDIYTADLEQIDKDKTLRDNFLKTNQALSFSGVSVLSSAEIKTAQATASTTYVALNSFQFAPATNGGLVVVLGSLRAVMSVQGIFVQMQVDGIEKFVAFVQNSGVNDQHIPIMWAMQLPAGKHTFKFNFKSNAGGSVTIGATDSISTLYILECRNAQQGV